MNLRIYVRKNVLNSLYAEVISEKNKVIRTVKGDREVYNFIKKRLNNSAVFISDNDKNGKIALGENFSIICSDSVMRNKPLFMEKLTSFYEPKKEFGILLRNMEDELRITKQQQNLYLKKCKKEQEKLKKKFYRDLLIFTTSVVFFVGGYAFVKNNGKSEEKNQINYEDLFDSTELTKVSSETEDKKINFTHLIFDNSPEITEEQEVYLQSVNAQFEEKEVTENIENETVIESGTSAVFTDEYGIIGTGLNDSDLARIDSFLNTDEGQKIKSACEMYDVDLASVLAIGINEFSLSSNNFYVSDSNGNAVYNPFQIDSITGNSFEILNVLTGEMDVITMDYESVTNPETHYTVAVAYIKTLMNKYNNNPNIFPAAYNMGEGTANLVISKIMDVQCMTYEEVLNLSDITLFSEEYDLICSDCANYYKTCSESVQNSNTSTLAYFANWLYSKYGDGSYTEKFWCYYIPECGIIISSADETIFVH